MNKPDKPHADRPPPDTVAEFQRRQKLATKYGAPPLIITVLCFIGLVVLFNFKIASPMLRVNLFITFCVIGIVSWGLHLYFDTKYNRCPNCELVPILRTGSVDVDPACCPNCGARLREYDSLF
jgi:hypothetical protein